MLRLFTLVVFIYSFLGLVAEGQEISDQYILVADSTKEYSSIDDILALDYFKNKVVYVDVWGTRCGPCLKEFKHASSLKQRFEDEAVVFLYLCSPYTVTWDAENAKRWRELIYEYELTGIHFLVSAECYEQGFYQKYQSIYQDIGMYTIPRYLLVNKNGEIVDFDASKPSDEEQLYDKIEPLVRE